MNKYHSEILKELKKHTILDNKGFNPPLPLDLSLRASADFISQQGENIDFPFVRLKRFNLQKYLGSTHPVYGVSVSKKREIAKNWIKQHKNISFNQFIDLLDSLYDGKSYEEKTFAGILIDYFQILSKDIDPKLLDKWLDNLNGWAEIDSLCQSSFKLDALLSKWGAWVKLIRGFAEDKNISKRRASLVLLTNFSVKSSDPRLAALAFEITKKLQSEKDILITKAVSWLLRSLVKHHRLKVTNFLKENLTLLPKIALRETKKKLLTGKKT